MTAIDLQSFPSWKRLQRTVIYDTPHMRVYEDAVRLPDGSEVTDYSIVELNDPVLIVATDTSGNIVMLQEYRYAVDATLWNLPAGSIPSGSEDVIKAARRELAEETGYTASNFTLIGVLYDYPTKAPHKVHVLRAVNAQKTAAIQREPTENIRVTLLRPEQVKKLVFAGHITTTAILSALVLALPELFGGAKTDSF